MDTPWTCSNSHRRSILDALTYSGILVYLDFQLRRTKMEFLDKFGVLTVVVLLAVSSTVLSQSGGRETQQNYVSVLDARQIMRQSVLATERSWQARGQYIYMEHDDDRRLDSLGQVKSENVSLTRMTLVNGVRLEQLMERTGQIQWAEEQKKIDQDFEKLKNETAAEQTERLRKDQENWSFLRDVVEAFDFRLIGEEAVDGRPAYVLQATPHPGYHARGKYGKIFNKVEGKLWVDKQDFGWIKVDGQVTQSFSMGLFVARVQRGSHIILDPTCFGYAVWVPKRLEVRASARILFLKSLDIDRILIYSDYRRASDGPYSVSR